VTCFPATSLQPNRAAGRGFNFIKQVHTDVIHPLQWHLNQRWRIAPVWLMGLGNCIFGFYVGLVGISLPQLLSAQHLPESQVASITAWVFSPWCWIFLLSPILDVRFSRRFYAIVLALIAGVSLTIGLMNLANLPIMMAALMTGSATSFLSASAFGGWVSRVLSKQDETRLSSWFNIANIAGSGVSALLAGELFHAVPMPIASIVLGLLIVLPTAIFPWIPFFGPDQRLARESFVQFFREILYLLRQRDVLVALAFFVAPSGSFALANVLTGLGEDYHAPMRLVSLVGGGGVILAGVVGSLIYPVFARRIALRPLYLLIGITGAVFTLIVLTLPKTPSVFALALIGETTFQALAVTGAFAIVFETIGQNNPFSATTFCVMLSALNISITYMVGVDGQAYDWHGLVGMYLTDAGLGIIACALLGLVLFAASRARPRLRTKMAV
jgi:PAT family beta-lactamase induction signal transducer AmpG